MKKMIFLGIAFAFLFMNQCHGQNFNEILKKTFKDFNTSNDIVKITQISNDLGLIVKKFPNEWSAHYYYAYSKIILSYSCIVGSQIDSLLDEAEKERDEAVILLKNETDETYILSAMIAQERIIVNILERWEKYNVIFNENIIKAKRINPNNPRIYYLLGVNNLSIPKKSGGGKKTSLPYFEKAEELFIKENKDDITIPSWGKEQNEYIIKDIKGQGDGWLDSLSD